jgi:gliding motility-associated lipoprotein GldB
MRHYFLFFILSLLLFSCKDEPKNRVDVSEVEIDLNVKRFDQDFYLKGKENLNLLKEDYPMLFPENTPDSIWISKMDDVDERELFEATQKVYQDFSQIESELLDLFRHVKYYNANFSTPEVITVLSNIDYEYRTIYSGELLLISLDVYLGKESLFYADYPDYVKENNTPERIVVDVANQIIDVQLKPSLNRTFLGKMITAGKRLYLLDLYVPEATDEVKIGYAKEKLLWAEANESEIWRYFIENDLLYSTNTKLNKRFLDEAPFSKFYLAQDSDSPGRIGAWMGWQIVRSFMEKNDVSLQSLLQMNEEELFKKANYKPKK